MKRSILTITATIALVIPAVASAATVTESFERDMDRNNTQITAKTSSGQDSFQQLVNVALTGEKSNTLIASFDRDLNRTATPAATVTRSTDIIQQLVNFA